MTSPSDVAGVSSDARSDLLHIVMQTPHASSDCCCAVLIAFPVETPGLAAGIVESVVLMGAPVSVRSERWAMARRVVSGRFVNAYSRRDWVLGLIYRGARTTGCFVWYSAGRDRSRRM